jgi:crossover junction endodeoxyribonuclease RusA
VTAWTIRDEGTRPLTINKVTTLHRRTWAKHTVEIRGRWHLLALEAKIPRLTACRITVRPLHANRTSPQDVAACAPEAKAAIDGLVDAGVLDDDDAAHVVEITFSPPVVCGVNGMELTIQETAP